MNQFFQNSRVLIIGSVLAVGVVSLTGCETDEDRKISAAQECFNKIDDDAVDAVIDAAVDKCLSKISGIETDGAYVIRCSGAFLKGGLTTSKIITAFDEYKTKPAAEKEAYLVTALALGSDVEADDAYAFCKKTGIPGLNYTATLARLGTKITQLGGLGGVPGAGTVQEQIDSCIDGTANAGAGCDLAEIGEMVADMSDLYCKGDAIEQQICIDIASATASAGTDYAALAEALLGQIRP